MSNTELFRRVGRLERQTRKFATRLADYEDRWRRYEQLMIILLFLEHCEKAGFKVNHLRKFARALYGGD